MDIIYFAVMVLLAVIVLRFLVKSHFISNRMRQIEREGRRFFAEDQMTPEVRARLSGRTASVVRMRHYVSKEISDMVQEVLELAGMKVIPSGTGDDLMIILGPGKSTMVGPQPISYRVQPGVNFSVSHELEANTMKVDDECSPHLVAHNVIFACGRVLDRIDRFEDSQSKASDT